VRLSSPNPLDPLFVPRTGATIKRFVAALRAKEEMEPHLGFQIKNSPTFLATPLSHEILRRVKETDFVLYCFLIVTCAGWFRRDEVASKQGGDFAVYTKTGTTGICVAHIHIHLRRSKTGRHGTGVMQIISLGEHMIYGDLREFLPYLEERLRMFGPVEWLFPYIAAAYRQRMRRIIIANADETLDLLAPEILDPDDYGLHSWRKTGAMLARRGGMNDYEIMQVGRWKSLEFTKYARVVPKRCADPLAELILKEELQRTL
jgi:integrase